MKKWFEADFGGASLYDTPLRVGYKNSDFPFILSDVITSHISFDKKEINTLWDKDKQNIIISDKSLTFSERKIRSFSFERKPVCTDMNSALKEIEKWKGVMASRGFRKIKLKGDIDPKDLEIKIKQSLIRKANKNEHPLFYIYSAAKNNIGYSVRIKRWPDNKSPSQEIFGFIISGSQMDYSSSWSYYK